MGNSENSNFCTFPIYYRLCCIVMYYRETIFVCKNSVKTLYYIKSNGGERLEKGILIPILYLSVSVIYIATQYKCYVFLRM